MGENYLLHGLLNPVRCPLGVGELGSENIPEIGTTNEEIMGKE